MRASKPEKVSVLLSELFWPRKDSQGQKSTFALSNPAEITLCATAVIFFCADFADIDHF